MTKTKHSAPDTSDEVRRLNLGPDLRDVVVTPSGLAVSRFKSASLIRLGPDGKVVSDVTPQRVGRVNPLLVMSPGMTLPAGQPESIGIDPAVAWRTLIAPTGTIVMLHQYGLAGSIGTSPSTAPAAPTNAYYGTPNGALPGCGACGGAERFAGGGAD